MRVYQRLCFPSVFLQNALAWAFLFVCFTTLLNFQESAFKGLKQFLELKKWARKRMIMFLKEKIR